MAPPEQRPCEVDVSSPMLPPTVWEKMREHAQEVAHQMEQRVQQALADGLLHDEEVEARPS
jgi:hypothetical protein